MRKILIALMVLTMLSSTVSACGVWRGAKDVNTDVGEGALSDEPGLLTGKRGAVVIYQK